jgi:hypothetical protein
MSLQSFKFLLTQCYASIMDSVATAYNWTHGAGLEGRGGVVLQISMLDFALEMCFCLHARVFQTHLACFHAV